MKHLTKLIFVFTVSILLFGCKDEGEPANRFLKPIEIKDTPDTPVSFGYKMTWLAIPTENTKQVVEALKLTNTKKCNWQSGIETAYSSENMVFVTPPVAGWTFVVGYGVGGLDSKDNQLMQLIQMLAKVFPDFYYFGTHRVVDYHSWIKVKDGKIIRAYAYLGESGETILNQGELTPEEIELNFKFFDEKAKEAENDAYFEREDLRWADEEDVINISKKWSRSTMDLETITAKSAGTIGTLRGK